MKYPESESCKLEFKREVPQNEQIIKTAIAFCNSYGGTLIIGVADDGDIIGVPEQEVDYLLEYVEKAILEATLPPIVAHVYTQRIMDKVLLFIEVAQGMNKPYFLKKEGKDRGVFVRLGRNTLRACENVIEELKLSVRGISFDIQPVYQACKDDLDNAKVDEFLLLRKSSLMGGELTQATRDQALHAYHLTTKDVHATYPTVSGIVLFGKNPQFYFPEARIICKHFHGVTMGQEVIASKECLGTLDEQVKAAYNFITTSLNRSWKIVGLQREETLEIPEQAIRELLINAVIHRNYHAQSPIKVAIFDDRVEIFSPGVFPGPIALNLQAGFTYLRNPAICKIFREVGLIENFGLGFITAFSAYEKAGLKNPDIIEGAGFVKCILPRRVPQNIRHIDSDKDDDDSGILKLFLGVTELSIVDIIKNTGFARSTAVRRLGSLIKKGLIKRIGKGRGIKYVRILD